MKPTDEQVREYFSVEQMKSDDKQAIVLLNALGKRGGQVLFTILINQYFTCSSTSTSEYELQVSKWNKHTHEYSIRQVWSDARIFNHLEAVSGVEHVWTLCSRVVLASTKRTVSQ